MAAAFAEDLIYCGDDDVFFYSRTCNDVAWKVLGSIAGCLWIITGILIIMIPDQDSHPPNASTTPAVATAVATPTGFSSEPIAAQSIKTVTTLPDGSIESRVEITNPDGSRTITITKEQASLNLAHV